MLWRISLLPIVFLPVVLLHEGAARAHDGPDPLLRWRFDLDAVQSQDDTLSVEARLGPDAKLIGRGRFIDDDEGGSLFLEGDQTHLRITDDHSELADNLPKGAMTISAWGTVDQPQRWC